MLLNTKLFSTGIFLSYIAFISFVCRVVHKVCSGHGLDVYYTGHGVPFNYISSSIVLLLIFATFAISAIIDFFILFTKFWLVSSKGDSMAHSSKRLDEIKKEVGGWSFFSRTILIISVCAVCILAIALILWGIPKYKVYRLELEGKARLKEAEWTKKITIETAKAEKEAASLKAEAEVERAKGVAEANKIIGESLKNNESYLRYLWIQGLQDGSSEVIYIPTEAGLPILEAGKRRVGSNPR